MTFDHAHQSTLVELARVQRERDALSIEIAEALAYADRLRAALRAIIADGTAGSLADVLSRGNARANRCVGIAREVLAGEIEPQDPVADAADLAAVRAMARAPLAGVK